MSEEWIRSDFEYYCAQGSMTFADMKIGIAPTKDWS